MLIALPFQNVSLIYLFLLLHDYVSFVPLVQKKVETTSDTEKMTRNWQYGDITNSARETRMLRIAPEFVTCGTTLGIGPVELSRSGGKHVVTSRSVVVPSVIFSDILAHVSLGNILPLSQVMCLPTYPPASEPACIAIVFVFRAQGKWQTQV